MNILSGPYYVQRGLGKQWEVRFSPTGGNSEVVEVFSNCPAAAALARKLNKKHSQPV